MSPRLTISLSKEAADVLVRYAEANSISKSRAANELIFLNRPRPSRIKLVDGIPLLDIPSKARKVSLKDYKRIQDREDAAEIREQLKPR